MKITIVLGAFFPVPPLMGGAVEKVWFALAQEFVRVGHEVVQISRSHPDLPAAEKIEGVQHLRVRGHPQPRSIVWLKWLDLLYSLRVRRILARADILVTNTFWLPLFVRREGSRSSLRACATRTERADALVCTCRAAARGFARDRGGDRGRSPGLREQSASDSKCASFADRSQRSKARADDSFRRAHSSRKGHRIISPRARRICRRKCARRGR